MILTSIGGLPAPSPAMKIARGVRRTVLFEMVRWAPAWVLMPIQSGTSSTRLWSMDMLAERGSLVIEPPAFRSRVMP